MDCFTFLDYVEGMRISRSFGGFRENLVRVRYSGSRVEYRHRNHFFTDWIDSNRGLVYDATEEVGRGNARTAAKRLNEKPDGSAFLPGIEPKEREIHYVPGEIIDESAVLRLKTGDYIGMYSLTPGLDVSHVGSSSGMKQAAT